ncbi:MAG: TAT-variant-translocated molybdopterin oxidoreductase, partial [Planctomycetota bacterium]|nr:TAT-variant-translocated molybdopterin oxidoreductase [Planctomycetota bacterium]
MPSLNSSDDRPDHSGCGDAAGDTGASSARARSAYWRSLDDLQGSEDFRAWMHREFPSNADLLEGDDRRQFIKVMGASFALAGLGAAACRRIPEQHIVPYASRPQERIPGKPVHYASSLERGGVGQGVLVRSYDARPVKLEGNPDHSTTMGVCDSMTQSEVLRVYDPHRSRNVLRDGKPSTANEFETWMAEKAGTLGRNPFGTGSMAILAEASGSPSMARMRQELAAKYPQASWHEYEAIDGDGARIGTRTAFGSAHRVHPRLDRADVVVCLDADPLMTHPASNRLAGDWATKRRLESADPKKQELSRVYSVEGVLSVTGMNADDRMIVRPGDVAAVAAMLAKGLDVNVGSVDELAGSVKLDEIDARILEAMIRDLGDHRGSSVVLAGEGQPPVVHALAAAINESLGNVGRTVDYTADIAPDRIASI